MFLVKKNKKVEGNNYNDEFFPLCTFVMPGCKVLVDECKRKKPFKQII